jgi:putative endonuclease
VTNQANRARGSYGERRVAEWYEARGYAVLDRNWRDGRAGELDLVLGRDGLVVFCEVKARRTAEFGDPLEAITEEKLARIYRLGMAWLAAAGRRGADVRIDVASVLGTAVDVLEGVG